MRWAVALAAAVAILFAVSAFRERLIGSLLYYPTPGIDVQPARLGIQAEDVFLETDDGVRIHSFWLEAPGADRAILFLHGNAGNASHRLPNAELLRRLACHVLLLDYRGYGLSDGRPDESGLQADARAGLDHLARVRGLPGERTLLFGRSLGGAVAVELAQGRRLAGVILESTWSSLARVGALHFGRLAAPLLRGRFDSAARIGRVQAPLLFFHGDRDTIVPLSLGQELFAAAPEPKQFETLAGAGHNDTVEIGGSRYLAAIASFLDRVAP